MSIARNLASLGLLALLVGALPAQAEAPRPNDSHALAGMTTGKAVFDITPAQPQKLVLFLKVIAQTREDLIRQGVKPELVLAFHGGAVKAISTQQPQDLPLDDEEALKEIAGLLAQLHQQGVRIEACSLATQLFGVANDTLLPSVTPVGNTFVSLIGYQAQGYAVVPVY